MNEIIEHVPGDQVVRVQAGIRLQDLQEQLSGSDQMLAIDPPEKGATIGGIIAANASGPRRYRYGTIRDLIIGITVVLHDGTVAKAGSKVVKNVAGHDLQAIHGISGHFRHHRDRQLRAASDPQVSRTVAVEVESREAAAGAAQAMMHTQVEPTAVELRYGEDARLLTVLLESIPAGVEEKVEAATFLLNPFGEVRTLSDEETGYRDPSTAAEDEAVIKLSAPPADLADVLGTVLGAAERRGLDQPRITGPRRQRRNLRRVLGRRRGRPGRVRRGVARDLAPQRRQRNVTEGPAVSEEQGRRVGPGWRLPWPHKAGKGEV